MRVLKQALVIASVLGMITAIGACQRRHEPMKLGQVDIPVQQVIPA